MIFLIIKKNVAIFLILFPGKLKYIPDQKIRCNHHVKSRSPFFTRSAVNKVLEKKKKKLSSQLFFKSV